MLHIMSKKRKKSMRADGPILDHVVVFPAMVEFTPRTKLPTMKSIIGVLKFLTDNKTLHEAAVKEVSKRVYAKYFHDTIYCISLCSIERRIGDTWNHFREGRKRVGEGKTTGVSIDRYREIFAAADKLYDFAETDESKWSTIQTNWGVKMSDKEKLYYKDQKSDRKMECDHGVDPVWYTSMMKKQRLREKEAAYKEKMSQQFMTKSLDEITDLLGDTGEFQDTDKGEDSDEETENGPSSSSQPTPTSSTTGRKRKRFVPSLATDDPLPELYRNLRNSERMVRDDVYKTLANLVGYGLSIPEAAHAVVEVGNGLFSRNWKCSDENEDIFDNNTLPTNKNIRDKLLLIETQSMALMVDEVLERSAEGRTITHAIDSTTRRSVGKFATQGIHIGQNVPFPLPLIGITSESTEDIALQIDFAFEVLASCRNISVEELYKTIDVHMTDSVDHNKGIADALAELYNLDKSAGQIFCGTHTTLGFSREMNKVVAMIEQDMKLDNILAHFMVDIAPDTKHDSIAGQALDMCLKLVAPEYSNKMWNKNDAFEDFLKKDQIENVLFAYKDQRFGCLSRAAAVLLFYWDSLYDFLEKNPHISNRLACLVRDLMGLPYLKTVYTVFAVLGVHLIEPFFCTAIQKEATHSKLKMFYQELYSSMKEPVTEKFFELSEAHFPGISNNLFEEIKKSYGSSVIQIVTDVASQNMQDCVKLTNFLLPYLSIVLARQRRDYGISDDFEPQYPVEMQADNIDDTPVHNLAMERQCGTVGHRVEKLKTLSAVARSMILQKTKQLRDNSSTSFRSFKKETEKRRLLELEWNKNLRDKFSVAADEKAVAAGISERKRLDLLQSLKECGGGPFTNSEEVRAYVARVDLTEKDKKKRLKAEIQFARDSSTSLPKADPLFKIQITETSDKNVSKGKKKRRDKNSQEFADALASYLGKRSDVVDLDYESFQASLSKLAHV